MKTLAQERTTVNTPNNEPNPPMVDTRGREFVFKEGETMEQTKTRTQLPQPGKDYLAGVEFPDYQVPVAIFDETDTVYQAIILFYLFKYARSSNGIFPGYGAIKDNCHISKNSVKRAIIQLVEKGLLEKIYRGKAPNGEYLTNLYRLNTEKLLKTEGGRASQGLPMPSQGLPIPSQGHKSSKPKAYKLNNTADNKKQETKPTPTPKAAPAGDVEPIPLDKIKFVPAKPDKTIFWGDETEPDQGKGLAPVGEVLKKAVK